MKFSHFLLATGLCSFSAASAQTTPSQTAPGTGTAAPSTVPSGITPTASAPRGAVSSGEVFTTGAPSMSTSGTSKHAKRTKEKSSMPNGNGKMKTKM